MNSNLSATEQVEYNAELKELSIKYPEILEWAEAHNELERILTYGKEEEEREAKVYEFENARSVKGAIQSLKSKMRKEGEPYSKKRVYAMLNEIGAAIVVNPEVNQPKEVLNEIE